MNEIPWVIVTYFIGFVITLIAVFFDKTCRRDPGLALMLSLPWPVTWITGIIWLIYKLNKREGVSDDAGTKGQAGRP